MRSRKQQPARRHEVREHKIPNPPDEWVAEAKRFGKLSGEAQRRRDAEAVVAVRKEFRDWLAKQTASSAARDELDSVFARAHRQSSGQTV